MGNVRQGESQGAWDRASQEVMRSSVYLQSRGMPSKSLVVERRVFGTRWTGNPGRRSLRDRLLKI